MYALLIAVAACIGITINGSCSADEDYDYYSGNELTTRAEREMGRGNEDQQHISTMDLYGERFNNNYLFNL